MHINLRAYLGSFIHLSTICVQIGCASIGGGKKQTEGKILVNFPFCGLSELKPQPTCLNFYCRRPMQEFYDYLHWKLPFDDYVSGIHIFYCDLIYLYLALLCIT